MACVNHRAFVYDKGGTHRLWEITGLQRLSWERVRDDISSASVTFVPGDDIKPAAAATFPLRHEVHIFRGTERVWQGPITLLNYEGSRVTFEARDVLYWTRRTIVRTGLSRQRTGPHLSPTDWVDGSISTVRLMDALIRQEVERQEGMNPPINLIPYLTPIFNDSDPRTSMGVEPWNSYVWDELDEAAFRGGIDYTCVGRQTYIFDTDATIGQTRTMTRADFADDIWISIYGAELATHSAVTDHRGNYGVVGAPNYYYGIVELLHTVYGAPDNPDDDWEPPSKEEMEDQARRNLQGRYPLPARVALPENARMNPVTVDEMIEYMIPGIRIPLFADAVTRPIEQMQKLDRFRIIADEEGELAQVKMSPATYNDDLVEA